MCTESRVLQVLQQQSLDCLRHVGTETQPFSIILAFSFSDYLRISIHMLLALCLVCFSSVLGIIDWVPSKNTRVYFSLTWSPQPHTLIFPSVPSSQKCYVTIWEWAVISVNTIMTSHSWVIGILKLFSIFCTTCFPRARFFQLFSFLYILKDYSSPNSYTQLCRSFNSTKHIWNLLGFLLRGASCAELL